MDLPHSALPWLPRKPTGCMPPRRHTRVVLDEVARNHSLPPLNEGFARAPDCTTPATSSSSSAAVAWVPPRADGQTVEAYGRGSKRLALQIAGNPEQRVQATAGLMDQVYAKTSKGAVAVKLKTWVDVATKAGFADPLALDADMLYDISAILWKAGFRSLDGYLSAVRQQLIIIHGDLPESFGIHFKRISRAAARGRGPAKQSSELPFERFLEIDDDMEPLSVDGPCHPRRFAIIASWWMLREIEAANLTLDCVSFPASNVTQLLLPASKADSSGKGTARSLGCSCASTPPGLCPFHLVKAQAEWVRNRAGAEHSSPFFPAATGRAIKKTDSGMLAARFAGKLGLPTMTPTGAPRYSGHSYRVTGAIHLAASGIDVWRIQLHGRWGSAAVLRYVRLAPLSSSMALEASLGRDLKKMQADITLAKAQLAAPRLWNAIVGTALAQDSLPAALRGHGGFLGPVQSGHVLDAQLQGSWRRQPHANELLIINASSGTVHAFRPPRVFEGSQDLEAMITRLMQNGQLTFCGWDYTAPGASTLHFWHAKNTVLAGPLCERCFGGKDGGRSSASSESSD